MARSVRPRARDRAEQVVFYDRGVGTGNTLDRFKGGAFGAGLNRNIQDAYRFLVHNHAARDTLYFFGFSRGAYTVRSLAGLLRNSGLLRKVHSQRIADAFQLYRSDSHPDSAEARRFRASFSRPVRIRFLGVWDTVGALGIPLRGSRKTRHSFHDTRISSIIQRAYHALAIDEQRKPFRPSIWTTKPGRRNTEQAWFAGVHGDVGGGYPEHGLSDHAFLWMCGKARDAGLDLNRTVMRSLLARGSSEPLHHSFHGLYRTLGRYLRPIGTSNPQDESVHESAVRRFHDSTRKYSPLNLSRYLEER